MKGLFTQKAAESCFRPGQAILCESGFSQYGAGSAYAQVAKKSPRSQWKPKEARKEKQDGIDLSNFNVRK